MRSPPYGPAWAASGHGQPFQSDKAEAGGTGLGLSIVHTIAEQHHGRLERAEADGFVTTLSIYIPDH